MWNLNSIQRWPKIMGPMMLVILTSMLLCACSISSNQSICNEINYGMKITAEGEYHLSGEIDDMILVDAPGADITIILDNVYIQPEVGPAISVSDADSVTIVVADGTDNTLKDAPVRYDDGSKENGCIYSKCNLYITGAGTINVYGYYQNAIRCKDRVSIMDTDIMLISKHDGINANDGINISSSNVSVQCEGNGIITTKVGKEDKGVITIKDSNIDIISGKFGVVTKADLLLSGVAVFNKSVLGEYDVEGDVVIEEGSLINE